MSVRWIKYVDVYLYDNICAFLCVRLHVCVIVCVSLSLLIAIVLENVYLSLHVFPCRCVVAIGYF